VNPRDVRQTIETISTVGLSAVSLRRPAAFRQPHPAGQQGCRGHKPTEKALGVSADPHSADMTVSKNTVHHDLILLAGGDNMTLTSL